MPLSQKQRYKETTKLWAAYYSVETHILMSREKVRRSAGLCRRPRTCDDLLWMSKPFIKYHYSTQTTCRLVLHSTNGHHYSILLPKCRKYSSQKKQQKHPTLDDTLQKKHLNQRHNKEYKTKTTQQSKPSNQQPIIKQTLPQPIDFFLFCLVW